MLIPVYPGLAGAPGHGGTLPPAAQPLSEMPPSRPLRSAALPQSCPSALRLCLRPLPGPAFPQAQQGKFENPETKAVVERVWGTWHELRYYFSIR